MRIFIALTCILVCGTFLQGCGTAAQDPIWKGIRNTAARLSQSVEPAPSLAEQRVAVLADVEASQVTGPVLLVELSEQQAVASLVSIGENNGVITWADPTGVGLSTRDGLVVSTRGLGQDLMVADVAGTQAALADGAGSYDRVHRYLDGEAQLGRARMACELSRAGDLFIEMCQVSQQKVENSYRMQDGVVWASTQWLGPDIGYARLERLR